MLPYAVCALRNLTKRDSDVCFLSTHTTFPMQKGLQLNVVSFWREKGGELYVTVNFCFLPLTSLRGD